eukprot:gene13582-14988_t
MDADYQLESGPSFNAVHHQNVHARWLVVPFAMMIALFHHYHAVSPKYTKREICMLLRKDHGVDITERQLKYICQKEGLSKHWNIESNLIKEMVSNELDTCRRKVGYRQMSEIVNLRSFVEEARLWDIDPEEIQVSFDAVNLYPSVPIDKAITVIVDILNKDLDDLKTRTKLTLTDIHKLIELCLSICYFLYNDQIRVIKNAGPIGLSLMVVIAEAYLQHIELKAIKEALTAGVPPISFKRYVDDSHSRFKSKPESEQFLGILNKQDKAIQFTVEYETEEKSINFLDVKIMNAKTGKYQFDIHRKDAITNVQVKPDSDAIEEIPHHAVSLSPRTN